MAGSKSDGEDTEAQQLTLNTEGYSNNYFWTESSLFKPAVSGSLQEWPHQETRITQWGTFIGN